MKLNDFAGGINPVERDERLAKFQPGQRLVSICHHSYCKIHIPRSLDREEYLGSTQERSCTQIHQQSVYSHLTDRCPHPGLIQWGGCGEGRANLAGRM